MSINKFKLSPEQLGKMQNLDEDIADLEDEIKKAKSVGLDVGAIETQLKAAKILKANIVKAYG